MSAKLNWVCVRPYAYRNMTPTFRKDELKKVSVAHEYVVETATVDVATLGGQFK